MKVRRHLRYSLLFLLGLFLSKLTGWAAFYDEATLGDLSDDYLAPTAFNLTLGDNTLSGSLSGSGLDIDLLELSVPPNTELTAIRVESFSGGGGGSFFGMQVGQTLSSPPSSTFPDPIGFALVGAASVGTDILPTVVVGPPFFNLNPLPEGNYALWLNETGVPSTYEFSFEVVAVPEPSALFVGTLILVAVLFRRRLCLDKSSSYRRPSPSF